MSYIFFFFFFSSRRRHTRLTCDWSSDVCSSDLGAEFAGQHSRDVDQGRSVRCAVRKSRRELPGHGRAVAQRGREDIEGVFELTMRDRLGSLVGGKLPQGLARESQGIV